MLYIVVVKKAYICLFNLSIEFRNCDVQCRASRQNQGKGRGIANKIGCQSQKVGGFHDLKELYIRCSDFDSQISSFINFIC